MGSTLSEPASARGWGHPPRLNPLRDLRRVAGPVCLVVLVQFGFVWKGSARASDIQIMPMGDSITYGYELPNPIPGGYRATMYRDLVAAGHSNFSLVGSETANADPTLPASAAGQEGHTGYLIAGTGAQAGYSLNGANLDTWLAPGNGVNPNLVLLEIGSNEILGNYHVQSAAYELAALVTHILELRPNAEVLVSTITPLASATLNAEVNTFNNALSGPNGIIAQLQAQGENVKLVDAGGTLTTADLSADGIHPSAAGYAKLGNAWAQAVEANWPALTAPEPSSYVVFGLSLAALGLAAQRQKSRVTQP